MAHTYPIGSDEVESVIAALVKLDVGLIAIDAYPLQGTSTQINKKSVFC